MASASCDVKKICADCIQWCGRCLQYASKNRIASDDACEYFIERKGSKSGVCIRECVYGNLTSVKLGAVFI